MSLPYILFRPDEPFRDGIVAGSYCGSQPPTAFYDGKEWVPYDVLTRRLFSSRFSAPYEDGETESGLDRALSQDWPQALVLRHPALDADLTDGVQRLLYTLARREGFNPEYHAPTWSSPDLGRTWRLTVGRHRLDYRWGSVTRYAASAKRWSLSGFDTVRFSRRSIYACYAIALGRVCSQRDLGQAIEFWTDPEGDILQTYRGRDRVEMPVNHPITDATRNLRGW